jgi:hypothetical protein
MERARSHAARAEELVDHRRYSSVLVVEMKVVVARMETAGVPEQAAGFLQDRRESRNVRRTLRGQISLSHRIYRTAYIVSSVDQN